MAKHLCGYMKRKKIIFYGLGIYLLLDDNDHKFENICKRCEMAPGGFDVAPGSCHMVPDKCHMVP